MVAKFHFFLSSLVALSGCASSSSSSKQPSSASADSAAQPRFVSLQENEEAVSAQNSEPQPVEPAEPSSVLVSAMPESSCEPGSSCIPPADFSRALCEGRYPGLAISMFEKSTPWERRYVKVESIAPVNTYGGKVTIEALSFTEEVLVLKYQSAEADGMKISGASDVDVLRWDGTCVTVREEFLSIHRMPTIKNASVKFRYLDDATQKGLLDAKYVNIRHEQQREACRSSSVSNPTPKCKKATDKLNDAITVAVRGGLSLPEPEKLPRWKVETHD